MELCRQVPLVWSGPANERIVFPDVSICLLEVLSKSASTHQDCPRLEAKCDFETLLWDSSHRTPFHLVEQDSLIITGKQKLLFKIKTQFA